MTIRPPAVAGLFYPDRPDDLRVAVDELLAGVTDPAPAPKALIVPHAGYVYSGSTAALGYATLRPVRHEITHVVVLGPCHRVGIGALALPGVDALATPLGAVPIWREGVERAAALPDVQTSPKVHADEHSLEVHLPFLQRALDNFTILPLAVGWVTPDRVAQVLQAVWGAADTLVVISSDLSHYHPYDDARRRDEGTIAQILDLDGPLDHEQACGATPINGLLAAAPGLRVRPSLFGACNSGDTAGDRRRVVGYATVGFYPIEEAGV
jgi:AmmeMemoRadiSam system protein B